MNEEKFYDLISLKLSGQATAHDLEVLEKILKQNPEWRFLYDQMLHPSVFTKDAEDNAGQAYAAFMAKLQLKKQGNDDSIPIEEPIVHKMNSRLWWATGIAASVFLFVFLLEFSSGSKKIQVQNETIVSKGSRSLITLPDSTKVWLNADSKLSYGNEFMKVREVTLIGEAFFDVTHDAAHPFIIHTGKADIKVLGTAFNVRNYPTDDKIETTLMRGKIEVEINDKSKRKIIMKPLEKLVIEKNDSIPPKQSVAEEAKSKIILTSVNYTKTDNSVAETSWLVGKMVFRNESFRQMANDIERNFGVTIIFRDTAIEKFRYSGTFSNENIEDILETLKLSKKFHYSLQNQTVIIY